MELDVDDILSGFEIDDQPVVPDNDIEPEESYSELQQEVLIDKKDDSISMPAEATRVYTASDSDLDQLIGRLNMWHNKCRDLFVDLRDVSYVASYDDSWLAFSKTGQYNKKMYFKADPQHSKDKKIIHAEKQFCKMLGVPHNFFISNTPSLRMNIVKTWQASLSASEEKAQCIIKIREGDDCAIIRSVLPAVRNTVPLHELLEIIKRSSPAECRLEFVHGDDKDDLVMHARILFEDQYDVLGRKMCMGFSLVASELDASPVIIDVVMHDVESATSFVASYGNGSFFRCKYIEINPSDIKELIPKMLQRILDERLDMIDRIKMVSEMPDQFIIESACDRIGRMKGVNGKARRSIYQQAKECEKEIENPFDFARHVCLVAKDFDSEKRLDIERAAGKYLNLVFAKE